MTERTALKYEKAGIYPGENQDPNLIPKYDVEMLAKAFPDVADMNFNLDEDTGKQSVTILNDKRGTTTVVPLGGAPPEETAELIRLIEQHYVDGIDTDLMDEAEAALAEFDDDDDDDEDSD